MKYLIFILFLFSLGADEQLLKKFDSYAEQQQQNWKVPGMAIAIVQGDQIIFSKGYGQRGLDDTQPVDTKTIFQIGSLTKAFTSALVAIGVDKGWFKWEDPVINHMQDFHLDSPSATTEFQMVDLFAQRSGLPPYAGDTQVFLGFSAEEMMQNLRFLKPVSSFRSQYAYQNIFFSVAAHILEKKTNVSYNELLKREIFNPLGMQNTTSSLQDYLNATNRAEWLMRLEDGSTKRLSDDFPYRNWNYILGSAGGINSNVEDMTKWLLLQINQGKQLISSDNMEKMTRPEIFVAKLKDRAMYYALGWVNMEYSPYPIIWHDGSTLGVYNVAAFIPQEKIGIVILTNVRNTRLALGLAFQFFDMHYNKPDQNWSQLFLDMKPEKNQPPPANPSPALSLSAYTGTYKNPIYGDALIEIDNNQLILTLRNEKMHLHHWDRDIFITDWPFFEEHGTKVIFSLNDKGVISTMQMDLLCKEGSGNFEKF